MKKHLNTRLLSLVLAVCMVLSLAAPVAAAPNGEITFTKVSNNAVSADLLTKVGIDDLEMDAYVDSDMVRVSIFLEEESTIGAGFSTESIAANSEAMAYRAELKNQQAEITAAIERKLGQKLDVVWNLTLAANLISANVKFGQIKAIEQVAGVKEVLIETRYEPDTAEAADPNTVSSSAQIGSSVAWANGYTGAGSRIAIIDTGSDTDHQSLNAEAFEYALSVLAAEKGMTYEEYVASLDLLDAEEILAVAADLNAPVSEANYFNTKLPFGYNYVDKSLDITHDNDSQGSHGSHVAGIATANSYIPTDDGFAKATEVAMVQGVAPEAQLITMKVFGAKGGAYDSDYMAAIEDAIVLGCDSANLSLGSGNPGTSRNSTAAYQAIMESLTEAGIVVAMSAGNSGYWVENAYNAGYLYADDVSMQTNGAPGSFTNSLSVASVDNDGKAGPYLTIGDLMIVYNEMLEGQNGAYKNLPFTTIAGEHEYVFIDGLGKAEEWAAVGSALEGKIAICSRGEISFFEKAQYAVEAGAIATFIYNNQAGVINMDLTDYPYTQPCASLTQTDGASIKAVSTPVTDEAGNILYYTGTMNISATMGVGQYNSAYYTMSSFSSWGVPGSLELKPEITAPGGNIYSINGVDKSAKAYEVMSGTSMAAPQVAGMAAIVAQYIRENGLAEQTGLSPRQLAQSLLMSTAVPMLDAAGDYYPVIQQGSGLANVGAAVCADSYITMADGSNAGAADGKVKVELGDDPARDGVYTATFTINNLTDDERVFELGADFFIQAPTSDGKDMYMYTSTALIGADVSWTVDGVAIEPVSLDGMDFNGDALVNSDDGQALLDYATGVSTELTNIANADQDVDGDVDSYDAYLFLSAINAGTAVVEANGSATVTVEISLSDMWKMTIDYYYPNGTYLQGYIFAESAASGEGVMGTSHSIPVLGFFGNWTEASMFDVGTYAEYAAGDETRTPYLNKMDANSLLVTYASEPGSKYYFGGNPLVADDTYMSERNAINSGDTISGLKFTAIRNASASKFEIINETTGEILAQGFPGAVSSAYYYVNGATWKNTGYTLNAQGNLSAADEGDIVSIGLTLAPEYYVDAEGNVNWDALAEGSFLGTTAVIDNTAPVIEDVALSLMGKGLTVVASDNNYIAAVVLYNKAGTEVLAYTGAKQDIAAGESAEYAIDMADVTGSKFLLQVVDYAMNTSTFVIEMSGSGEDSMPAMIGFNLNTNKWVSYDTTTTSTELEPYASSQYVFYAATIVDHMVLACDDSGNLYVMPEKDLSDVTLIANTGTLLADMAYSKDDDTIYAVDANGQLVTVDRLTADVQVVGQIGVATNTLACDANGTFYCNGVNNSNGIVYSFTLDTMDAPVQVVTTGIKAQYIQSMEIDPNTGLLYWNSFYTKTTLGKTTAYAYLYEIDVNAGTYTRGNDLKAEICALIIPEKTAGGGWTNPTNTVSSVKISQETASVLKGGTVELAASVLPWTATDRTVTWTSSDETVATVDENGVVNAIAAGTAVITATSNLDASFSASCEITVNTLDITINGTLQDVDGSPMLYSWNMAEDDTWVGGTALDTSMTSATYNTAADKYYIMDAVSNSWSMHVVDPVSGESESVTANATGIPLWDMVYSEYYSTEEAPKLSAIYYYYLLPVKDPLALDTSAFGLSSYLANYTGASYLTAVASAGYEQITSSGKTYDSERILMLDNAGVIWSFWVYPSSSGYGASLNYYPSDLNLEFPGYEDDMYCSMVVGEDGNLYLSAFDGNTNELYQLVYDAASDSYVSTYLGNVGDEVWPATITSVTTNGDESNGLPAYESIDTIYSAPVTEAELAAAKLEVSAAAVCTAASFAEETVAEVKSDETDSTIETTVTIDVTADVLATNGIIDINWDANVLELISMVGSADYTASKTADGSVLYGFVALDGIEADESILTLKFKVLKDQKAAVIINQKQINNAAGMVEEFVINEYAEPTPEPTPEPEITVVAEGWSGYTTWVLTSDGTLTFSPTEQALDGETNLKNYWKVNGVLTLPWGAYADMITTVVIEDGIHDIGQMAFYELKNLTTVKLGADVTEIRNYAFKNCSSLTDINLGGVDYIREGAFYGCSALENVDLSDADVIEDWAFSLSGVKLN